MKNITISMEEKVARWVRIEAAKCETSVSRFVGEILRRMMEDSHHYERAMHRDLKRKVKAISSGSYPSREELYDRPVLRR